MRWMTAHVFDILKIAVLIVTSIGGAWGVMQQQVADLKQEIAVQNGTIASLRGSLNRLQKDSDARELRIEKRLDDIATQLGDISKSVAVFADRFQYRGGKIND